MPQRRLARGFQLAGCLQLAGRLQLGGILLVVARFKLGVPPGCALALLEGSDRPGLALRSLRGSFRAPYDGADQQDAAEFLHYVLDALEDEADLGGPALVGDAAKRAAATRELDAVFGGVLETSIECERGGAVATTRHGVCGKFDVCVPDDGAPRKNEVGCAPREPAAKPAALQDLVRDQYLASEVLEGDAAYACDACAAKVLSLIHI
mgnify:CR=1 FL=1